ncbi:MAG: hypothetical protein Q4E87_11080 [bacterium]|nr:hypothetical protein [bacterium]
MELDSIKKIITAEQEAETIKEEAKKQVGVIKEEALQEKEKQRAEMEKELQAEKEKIRQLATAENKCTVENIIEQAKEECMRIAKDAQTKQNQAIDSVIKKVVM